MITETIARDLMEMFCLKAERHYNKAIEVHNLVLTQNTRCAGRAIRKMAKNTIELDTSYWNLAGEAIETIAHEVAHIVMYTVYPQAKPHGIEWKECMKVFGYINAKATFTNEVQAASANTSVVRRQRRWEYKCKCVGIHSIATVTHNKMQKGRARNCMSCKNVIEWTGKEIKK